MANKSNYTSIQNHIKQNLNYTLNGVVLPELGPAFKGKIRDIYRKDNLLIMICSDRISVFDSVLNSLIPYKGAVLNQLTLWAFKQTSDIVPNALIENQPDPNVIIQKKVKPFPVEFIVRGYLWGSLAAGYEASKRTFCDIHLSDDLLRYQEFDDPIFTPTTKAPQGQHDEPLSMSQVEDLIGKENAAKAKLYSLQLYKRGSQLAKKGNLILIDTKYEFGLDENNNILVIDEVNTPDSSRLCEIEEWKEKFTKIKEIFKQGKYSTVSELLKDYPALKIKEYSKQFVRDTIIEKYGHNNSGYALTQDEITECSLRYIEVYENLTGQKWKFPQSHSSPEERLYRGLVDHNYIEGCCAVILGGSSSDKKHLEEIQNKIFKLRIPSQIRICSAHKQAEKLMELINYYNTSIEPLVYICCAGGTDALSGTVSYHALFPAVSCPPDSPNPSCCHNPPGSSNAYIEKPDNVAKFVMQVFSCVKSSYKEALKNSCTAKINDLNTADSNYTNTPTTMSITL